MSFILGVTGGIGSGKTAVTDQLSRHGIPIIDADLIARQVVSVGSPALADIAEHFGDSILLADGTLNRPLLRETIFKHSQEKQWLEGLLHPLIRDEIKASLAASTGIYSVLSAPLLLENNLNTETDSILVVDCDEQRQIERASARDNSTPDTIKAIMQQQLSRQQRIAHADTVITNNGSLADLHKAVDAYHFALVQQLQSSPQDSLPQDTLPQNSLKDKG